MGLYWILFVLVAIGIFLVCREFVCWYCKFNEMVALLKSIESKLSKSEDIHSLKPVSSITTATIVSGEKDEKEIKSTHEI